MFNYVYTIRHTEVQAYIKHKVWFTLLHILFEKDLESGD